MTTRFPSTSTPVVLHHWGHEDIHFLYLREGADRSAGPLMGRTTHVAIQRSQTDARPNLFGDLLEDFEASGGTAAEQLELHHRHAFSVSASAWALRAHCEVYWARTSSSYTFGPCPGHRSVPSIRTFSPRSKQSRRI